MANKFEPAAPVDLLAAYRDGLFSHDELIEAAGPELWALAEESPETMIRLADTFGGTEVWVPVEAARNSRLCSMLSEADVRILIDIYRGCKLKVKSLKSLKLALRRRKAAALRAAGWKMQELARYFQVSDRQILNMLKRHREEDLA